MRHSVAVALRAGIACVSLASLLLVNSLAMPRGAVLGPSQASASVTICAVPSKACPAVVGVSYPSTSEASVTKFMTKLWIANFASGTPADAYQLQLCENNNKVPYRVTCVLYSTGTRKNLLALKKAFTSSRLFKNVAATFPKA